MIAVELLEGNNAMPWSKARAQLALGKKIGYKIYINNYMAVTNQTDSFRPPISPFLQVRTYSLRRFLVCLLVVEHFRLSA